MTWLLLLALAACPRKDPVETGDSPHDTGDTPVDTSPDTDTDTDSGIPDGPVKHVVILVTDGARSDETIFDGESNASGGPTADIMPYMRAKLWPQGTLLRPGYATGVTETAEGHVSILTGSHLPQSNMPSDFGAGWFRPEAPTLYEAVRSAEGLPQEQVGLVANTEHLQGHTSSVFPGLGEAMGAAYTFLSKADMEGGGDASKPADDDAIVWETIQEQMTATEVRFVLGNLHEIDRSGHTRSGAVYVDRISEADEGIVDFWEWVQATEPYKDTTLLVVASDHGRHRWEGEEEDWKEHGDQCAGCRQVQVFLVGPGIKAGEVITSETFTLDDLSRTVAHLMGVDLPYASGMIIAPALTDPPGNPGRTGDVWPSVAGDLSAWQSFTDDPFNQSQVFADGELLSTMAAIHAEHPVAASDGSTDVVCWNQLVLTRDTDYSYETWDWRPECWTRTGGGAWTDTHLDETTGLVWPFFDPALAIDASGRLWLAYMDNPKGSGDASVEVSARVLRYTPGTGWEGIDAGFDDVSYPIYPTLLVDGDRALLSYTTSHTGTTDEEKKYVRYERHLDVLSVDWPEGGSPSFSRVFSPEVNDIDHGDPSIPYARYEHPQLTEVDGTVHLATVAYGDTVGNTIVTWRSEDGGATWTDPVAVDPTGMVIGLTPPRWSTTGHLYWARKAGADAEICRIYAGDTTPECKPSGGAEVQGLAATATGVKAAVGTPAGTWTLTDLVF